jgi:2',3'-cyclic-nucleotide 2'-phosphodiesterase (5'-nucleotidase family)
VGAVGLGPADLPKGPEGVRFARESSNVADPAYKTEPPKVITVGDAKIGVFGVIANDTVRDLKIDDPVAAGKKAVEELKKQGAQVVVGLVQASNKRDAVALIRDIGGIDVSIAGLGQQAPEPNEVSVDADKIGDGWLVIPGNRGQVLSRIDITLRGGSAGPLVDAIGPGAAQAKIEQLDRQLATLDGELAKFKQDKDAVA